MARVILSTRPRRRWEFAERTRLTRLALFALSARSCSDALPSPSRVSGLRVLAVLSSPPELGAADARATLRAVTVDGAPTDGGAGRARSIRWFLCAADATDDPARCARDAGSHALAGDGETLVLERASLGARGARTALLVLCPGRPAEFDRARSMLACPDEAGREWAQTEGVLAFETVRAAAAGSAPNRAPSIALATLDGQSGPAWSAPRCSAEPCPRIELAVTAAEGSAELVGATREELTASYYATAGSFDRPRVVSADGGSPLRARWSPPASPMTVRAWVVLRDDRGAAAVIERVITVR